MCWRIFWFVGVIFNLPSELLLEPSFRNSRRIVRPGSHIILRRQKAYWRTGTAGALSGYIPQGGSLDDAPDGLLRMQPSYVGNRVGYLLYSASLFSCRLLGNFPKTGLASPKPRARAKARRRARRRARKAEKGRAKPRITGPSPSGQRHRMAGMHRMLPSHDRLPHFERVVCVICMSIWG